MIKYQFENGDKVPKIARTQAPEHYTFKDMNEIKDFINTKTDGQLVQGDLDATTPVYVAPHWKDKNDLDAWIVKDTEITLVTTAHGTISGTIATNEATRLVIHGYHKISLTEMKVGIVTIEFDATGVITKIDDPDASSNWPIKPLIKHPLQSDMFPLLEENKAYSFLDSDDKFVIGTVVEKTATEATICGERYFKDRGECVRYTISSTGATAPTYVLRTQFVKNGVQAFEAINKQQLDALEISLKAYVGSEGNKKQNNLTTAQLAVVNANPFLATLQTKYDGYQALIATNTSGVAKNLASITVNIADIKTNKDNITSLQGRSRNRGRFDTLAAANAFFTPLAGTENKLNDQDMVLIGAIAAVNFTEYFWEESFTAKPAPDLKWRLGGSVIQGSSTFGDGTDIHLQTGAAYSKKENDDLLALKQSIAAATAETTRVNAELAKKIATTDADAKYALKTDIPTVPSVVETRTMPFYKKVSDTNKIGTFSVDIGGNWIPTRFVGGTFQNASSSSNADVMVSGEKGLFLSYSNDGNIYNTTLLHTNDKTVEVTTTTNYGGCRAFSVTIEYEKTVGGR